MKNKIHVAIAVTALSLFAKSSPSLAADHTDSPAATDDPVVDISDFYAWHTEEGRLVLVLNYAGLQGPGGEIDYDEAVLYGFHIDRDADQRSDHDIWIRFGQDNSGAWGVQIHGLPQDDVFVGAVGNAWTTAGGANVFCGPRDDPFFFDFEGYVNTLNTGTLSFDATRDSFAGTNVQSIVLEIDLAAAAQASTELSIWATSGRKG